MVMAAALIVMVMMVVLMVMAAALVIVIMMVVMLMLFFQKLFGQISFFIFHNSLDLGRLQLLYRRGDDVCLII